MTDNIFAPGSFAQTIGGMAGYTPIGQRPQNILDFFNGADANLLVPQISPSDDSAANGSPVASFGQAPVTILDKLANNLPNPAQSAANIPSDPQQYNSGPTDFSMTPWQGQTPPWTAMPPMMPPDVSLQNNAVIGKALSYLPSGIDSSLLPFSPLPLREVAMDFLFNHWMPMDYQRTYGTGGKINPDYINAGNYNFGLVSAKAGYSLPDALLAAGLINQFGSGLKTGPFGTNPLNNEQIINGYNEAGAY